MSDRRVIYRDDVNKRHLYEKGPEGDRTVVVMMGQVVMDLFPEDAEALYQMLGKWRDQTPGLGWDDDPLAIRERK